LSLRWLRRASRASSSAIRAITAAPAVAVGTVVTQPLWRRRRPGPAHYEIKLETCRYLASWHLACADGSRQLSTPAANDRPREDHVRTATGHLIRRSREGRVMPCWLASRVGALIGLWASECAPLGSGWGQKLRDLRMARDHLARPGCRPGRGDRWWPPSLPFPGFMARRSLQACVTR
jgi:hypothetical protein